MKTAIYPGSFDPFTFGHLDIAKRGLEIFDKLIIAIGNNKNKKYLFTTEQWKQQIETVLNNNPKVEIVSFDNLLVDLARELNVYTIIRGLRAVSDFEFEFQLATTNRKLEPKMESFFMMTSERFFYFSSSIVKEIASHNGDVSSFVPKNIALDLKQIYTKQKWK